MMEFYIELLLLGLTKTEACTLWGFYKSCRKLIKYFCCNYIFQLKHKIGFHVYGLAFCTDLSGWGPGSWEDYINHCSYPEK